MAAARLARSTVAVPVEAAVHFAPAPDPPDPPDAPEPPEPPDPPEPPEPPEPEPPGAGAVRFQYQAPPWWARVSVAVSAPTEPAVSETVVKVTAASSAVQVLSLYAVRV